MKKTRFIFCALLFVPIAGYADLRVGLFQKELPDHFWVSSAGGLRVLDPRSGRTVLTLPGQQPVTMQKAGEKIHLATAESSEGEWKALRLEPVQPSEVMTIGTEQIPQRPFHGILEVEARLHELLAINVVSEEDYLNAVVADEMPVSWPIEALKAQAVVARTYLRRDRGRHTQDGYDFCDLTHCQVYQGASKGNSAVRKAVSETKDEVLTYKGHVIETLFHSTCGGHTASADDVWQGSARPYLRGQPDSEGHDDFCRRSPDYSWSIQMNRQDLTEILKPALEGRMDPGVLQSLAIRSRDSSGRVKEMDIRFTNEIATISGYKFYLLWGRSARWHQLKSTWFEIGQWGDTFEFRGKGLGHGVGMCQWGAYGRALQGQSYRDILAHYYPGTQFEKKTP